MQKITTRIFIAASVLFGITGLCLVFLGGPNDTVPFNQVLLKILMACVFIILPSFALSIAHRYLRKD